MSIFLRSCILFFIAIFALTAQNNESKTTEVAKNQTDKKEEGKPLKMETGTVTVDPQIVSADYKRTNLKILKKLKSSFLNHSGEERFKALTKDYVDANIKYQEKNYLIARRLFEQNYIDINKEAEKFTKKYSELYAKLYSDASTLLVDYKVNSDSNDTLVSALEKNLVSANEFYVNSQNFIAKKNHIDALSEYKSAMQNIFKVFTVVNKNKSKKSTVTEKVQNSQLIEDDFVPKEYLKDYDDSYSLVFQEREKEREKERDSVKKSISNKYGEIKTTKTEKLEEPKKEVKTVEPAKK